MIYADHAATTALCREAYAEMVPWLDIKYANPSTLYSLAREPRKAISSSRETIARCINADPEEIFFTSGGTESDNWAIKGSAFCDADKRMTVVSAIEHHAVLNSCAMIERLGYPVSYLPADDRGVISDDELERMLSAPTHLVSVMLANNEIGTIQPVKELASVAHEHGALFHTDAVQAVGHIPIDVKELNVDMLSASAHKFNGPKGIGFLYIKKGTRIFPYMDGGTQETGMRAGTENVASIVGMAVALKKNCDNLKRNIDHTQTLEMMLLQELSIAGIKYVRNGSDNTLPGLISLSFEGKDGEAILHRMDLMGICISTGAACDSKNTQISHVLKAIHLDESLARGTIRISLGKDNTSDEVLRIVGALKRILE